MSMIVAGFSTVVMVLGMIMMLRPPVMVIWVVMTVFSMVVTGPMNGESGCRDAGTQDFGGVHVRIAEREAAERVSKAVERKAGVEEGADGHVAGNAREAVEVQNAAHSCPISLKL